MSKRRRATGNDFDQVARQMRATGEVDPSELVEIVADPEDEIRAFVSRPWGSSE